MRFLVVVIFITIIILTYHTATQHHNVKTGMTYWNTGWWARIVGTESKAQSMWKVINNETVMTRQTTRLGRMTSRIVRITTSTPTQIKLLLNNI